MLFRFEGRVIFVDLSSDIVTGTFLLNNANTILNYNSVLEQCRGTFAQVLLDAKWTEHVGVCLVQIAKTAKTSVSQQPKKRGFSDGGGGKTPAPKKPRGSGGGAVVTPAGVGSEGGRQPPGSLQGSSGAPPRGASSRRAGLGTVEEPFTSPLGSAQQGGHGEV